MGKPETIFPTLSLVARNRWPNLHESCQVAYLVTFLLEIEFGLDSYMKNYTCAELTSPTCLRRSRGIWKMYLGNRTQLSAGKPSLDSGLYNILIQGESRVMDKFHQSL